MAIFLVLLNLSSLSSFIFQLSYSFLVVEHRPIVVLFHLSASSPFPHFPSYSLEISAVSLPIFFWSSWGIVYSLFMCSMSSLSCSSPSSLCFLLKILSSIDPADVILSSSITPPCSLKVISRVVSFFMLLSSIVFLSLDSFDSRGAAGLSGLILAVPSLSLVTLDADFSADRFHGHVEEFLVHLVHTFIGDRLTLFNIVLEEVILQLIAFGLMSLRLGSRFPMFWFTLSLPLSLLLCHWKRWKRWESLF